MTTQPLPTGKMGFGNVKISLALAQQSLSQQGITQPTSQQLYTALAGGQMTPGDPTTTTTGILQMRADGMGWGQIAQKYNVKLGQLMSGKQPASTTPASTTTTSTTNKGITTAAGKSSTTFTGKGNGNDFSGSKSQDSGIVSASGRSAGTYSSSNGNGIVSGSGRSIGQTSGIVTGAGLIPLAVFGSVFIGIILIIFANRKSGDNPFILIVNCRDDKAEKSVTEQLLKSVKKYAVKSKTVTAQSVELTVEIRLKDATTEFVNEISRLDGVSNAALVSYNGEYMA
jgi:hypothetical protein